MMEASKWIDLILVLSTGFSTLLFLRRYLGGKSLLSLYFSLASFAICVPYCIHIFDLGLKDQVFEWGKLIAIITYISGLLILIRQSKPAFARFPAYMTALPFISILFFPLMLDSYIIKDLLNAIYQGGALFVTGLIFTINFAKAEGRRYYLMGVGSAAAAYTTYWVYFNRVATDFIWISEMLLAVAIVVTSLKFIQTQTDTQELNTA